MLGSRGEYHSLRSPGWDGHPTHTHEGQVFYLDTEHLGPPAKHETDPKRWGRTDGP